MGGKKRKLAHIRPQPESHRRNSRPNSRPPPKASSSSNNKAQQQQQQAKKNKKQEHVQQQHQEPTIPFSPTDRILLLGEGDLSFAASLTTHHGCTNLVATVLEKSEKDLLEKYPHAAANIQSVVNQPPPPKKSSSSADNDDEENYETKDDTENPTIPNSHFKNKIVYSIDTTKPFPKSISHPPPNRIIFNFPHVGGKSTDVNRQVRYNQSLLVSTFRNALPILPPGGTITVTLFEGEPYTLWNVRDLARHAGLQVDRSFKFQAMVYPGYRHARTLGVVMRNNKKGNGGAGGGEEATAAWRGENRPSRSYVFMRKGDVAMPVVGAGVLGGKRKRKGGDDDDDSESEAESEPPYESDCD